MENIDIIKKSVEDSAIKSKFSMLAVPEKYTVAINTYRSLFDKSTKDMQEEDIDTFLAATFLLKAMIINDVMLNREDTCALAVDTCIAVCENPLIIENGKVHKLNEADYSWQKAERDVLVEELLKAKNEAILNSDISQYLRDMYIGATKVEKQDTTSNNYQKLKSIFSK